MGQVSDVVVVGGGIAGAAMATSLSRAGKHVLLLERQPVHRDRVRGEVMVPWGVAEARRLGLLDVLLSAGAGWLTRRVAYDELVTPQVAEATALPLDRLLPDVPGSLCFFQPSACQALMLAAAAAGADVRTGVRSVTVTAGERPEVTYEADGTSTAVRCRLVIGADGRSSSVRGQAGIRMQRLPAEHLVSGLLVDGVDGFPRDMLVIGVEGDVTFFVCPQGAGRARLYLCHALQPHGRFAGRDGPAAFLRAFRLRSVPRSEVLASSTVSGPCGTMQGGDTWAPEPFARGVVLIGDAAGYNNPLIGQGLSLAMRDVRVLSELLLNDGDWSPEALRPYAEERMERMRRVRLVAAATVGLLATYTAEARERRRRFGELMSSNRELAAPFMAAYAGPETAPAQAFTPSALGRGLGPTASVPQ